MRTWTYRLVLVGSLLSAFLAGMHMPIFHEIIEHGAAVRMDIVVVTILLIVFALVGGLALFFNGPGSRGR